MRSDLRLTLSSNDEIMTFHRQPRRLDPNTRDSELTGLTLDGPIKLEALKSRQHSSKSQRTWPDKDIQCSTSSENIVDASASSA